MAEPRECIYAGKRYRLNTFGEVLEWRSYNVPRLSPLRMYGKHYEKQPARLRNWITVTDPVLERQVRAVFRSTEGVTHG